MDSTIDDDTMEREKRVVVAVVAKANKGIDDEDNDDAKHLRKKIHHAHHRTHGILSTVNQLSKSNFFILYNLIFNI